MWRVTAIRVKPAQMDAYLSSLRQSTKPLLDEEKRQGIIMDYKVFLKETQNDPKDWDIALAVLFKNHAAMDNLAAKGEMVRDKILGRKTTGTAVGGEARGDPRDRQLGAVPGDHVEVRIRTT